jgi:REP element-mobilizing transposase RayT
MSYYERNLPHIQRDFKPHFLTFATHKRRVLQPWARDIVLRACRYHDEKTCLVMAAVVMPDHVHLIVFPLIDEKKKCVVALESITDHSKGIQRGGSMTDWDEMGMSGRTSRLTM